MKSLLPALCIGVLALAGCGKPDAPGNSQADISTAAPEATTQTATTQTVTPTAAMGEQIFKRCVACHNIAKDGPNGIGPNLHGIVGRAVASHAGFSYSPAMKAKGGHWDAATLDKFLEQPMTLVPGTRMAFAGIPDATDRAALLLYLTAQKD